MRRSAIFCISRRMRRTSSISTVARCVGHNGVLRSRTRSKRSNQSEYMTCLQRVQWWNPETVLPGVPEYAERDPRAPRDGAADRRMEHSRHNSGDPPRSCTGAWVYRMRSAPPPCRYTRSHPGTASRTGFAATDVCGILVTRTF